MCLSGVLPPTTSDSPHAKPSAHLERINTASDTSDSLSSSDSSTSSAGERDLPPSFGSGWDIDDSRTGQCKPQKSRDVWASAPDIYLPLSYDVSADWFGFSLTHNRFWVQAAIGLAHAIPLMMFSLKFPFLLAPESAPIIYHNAGFKYVDDFRAVFDNTAWTYATDYLLAVIMAGLAMKVWTSPARTSSSSALRTRSSLLLTMYCLSVSAGGLSHHFFTTVDSRNTWEFRCLWTLCVATVCIASAFLGMSATGMHRHVQQELMLRNLPEPQLDDDTIPLSKRYLSHAFLRRMPIIPEFVWFVIGTFVTAVCVFGGMSFHRPACDIFIAGITQSPSSLYLSIYFWCLPSARDGKEQSSMTVHPWIKAAGSVCFLMNAPLLPMYPILNRYTPLTLPAINALYHFYLTCSWSLQGLCLWHVQQRMEELAATKKVR